MPDAVSPKRFDDDSSNFDFSQATTTGTRVATQVFGLLLMLIGGYYGLQIASDVLTAVRKPATLDATLTEMNIVLGLAQAEIPVGPRNIPLGRLIGGILLFFGYFIAMLITMRLVTAGARLVLGLNAERRAFYEAVKQFATAIRWQQEQKQ